MILLYLVGAFAAFILLYFLYLFLWGLPVDMKKEYTKDSPFYRRLLMDATVFGFWLLRVKIHVSGAQKLPDGPILFVENHRSNYDPLVTWHAFRRRRLAFVSKPSNFRIPFFGPLIRRCCFLAIDRENPRNAMQAILKAARLMTEESMDVAIYPEGTRNHGEGLLPFHNGVFKIAQRANAPIAVLCVTGTEKICHRTPLRRTDVYLDVLEVIPAEQVKHEKTEVIGEHVRDLLLKNIEEREHHDLHPV